MTSLSIYTIISLVSFKIKVKDTKTQRSLTMNPDIIYEDNDIIVCHKPAGTATQSSRIGAPDMVSILKNHIYRNSDKKKEPYLSVIHRLDQPV